MNLIRQILRRRAQLNRDFNLSRSFDEIEESCIPSYLHRNPAAAAVAWWRLSTAAKLYRRYALSGPILDFGSGSGELYHLLATEASYDFVEANEVLARALLKGNPGANQRTIAALPSNFYLAVFALDSLEHNDDVSGLLHRLAQTLNESGVLILSGPTENSLYRLGRGIAGFGGHYHKTTIGNIERLAATEFELIKRTRVPLGLPLFSISVWKLRKERLGT